MLRVFSRICTNRRDPKFGQVEIQIRDVRTDAPFSTTQLTNDHKCVHPVVVDGQTVMCGREVLSSANHGWLCHHHARGFRASRMEAWEVLNQLDADNIEFILGQDRKAIEDGKAVKLGRFRGWVQPDLEGGSYDAEIDL